MEKNLKLMPIYSGETNEDYTNGNTYHLMQVPMIGKIYEPGKDVEGKFLDRIGKRDTRIMVWKSDSRAHDRTGFKVYQSQEAINKDWYMP